MAACLPAALLFGAALAILLGFLRAFPLSRHEPVYDGCTLSAWLCRIENGQWGVENEAPIRAIGTNGIPTYLKWIAFEETSQRPAIANHLHTLSPRLASLVERPGGAANRTVSIFRILGPQARAAVPALTRLAQTARDPARVNRCLNSLAFIGQDALPGLVTVATNSPSLTRSLALWKLSEFGTNNVAVWATLRVALTNNDPWVTNTVNSILLKIAPDWLTNPPSD